MNESGAAGQADLEGSTRKAGAAWTGGAVAVAALALISALLMIALNASLVTHESSLHEPSGGYVAPFVVVLALIATGFRRLGDVVAIPVACWFGFYFGVASMLSLNPSLALFAVFQAITVIVAVSDLWRSRNDGFVPIAPRIRLIGLGASLAVGVSFYFLLEQPIHAEAARRARLTPAQRSAEVGYDVTAPKETDSTFAPAPDWVDWDPRMQLMGLANCIEAFRGIDGGPYPTSLREVKRWALRTRPDNFCARILAWKQSDTSRVYLGSRNGHLIRYTPASEKPEPYRPGNFTLESEAVVDSAQYASGTRIGLRNYLLDGAGKLHMTTKHRRATLRDPALPDCDPPHFTEVSECSVVYPPRRRWGAFPLAHAGVYPTGSTMVGSPFAPMVSFSPVGSLDPIARVTIQWNDVAGAPPEELPLTSERHYEDFDWNRWPPHEYKTPGTRTVTVVVTLRSGAVYEGRSTVEVAPRR